MARLAARQYGLVTAAQLHACGMSEREIRRRVARGRLHRRHRGVYAVGHGGAIFLQPEYAALLAAGPDAVLSHRSAAVFWGLLPPRAGSVDVTVPDRSRRAHEGIVVHRPRSLPARDVWTRKGLRVTSPHRTLLDLAAVVGPAELAKAVDEAYVRRLVRPGTIVVPDGARGAARLRAVLAGRGITRSGLERRFLTLVKRAGLPMPETNTKVAGHEVDVVWRAQRVVVELDTLGTHATRVLTDREKDLDLRQAGFTTLRFTDQQLERATERILVTLGQALGSATP